MDDTNRLPELVSFKDRLNYLFETVRPVGKSRYTVREVSEAVRRDHHVEISPAYIGYLCKGERDNPNLRQVQALAAFFGVPTAFLFGEGDITPIARDLEKLRAAIETTELLRKTDDALNDPGVRVVALKARGVSAEHLDLVSTMLDKVRRLEGLE